MHLTERNIVNMKVIGVAGFARAGKDTFVGIAIDILKANSYRPMRVAFADKLKDEVEDMLIDNKFNATVKTNDTAAKTLIRPLLVWWGCQRRLEGGNGLYWVNEIDKQLNELCADYIAHGESHENVVVLVSDVRFPNEVKWIQEKWQGSVIHLKRWKTEWCRGGQDGSDEYACKTYDSAPNEEEAKQDPLVEALANVHTEWENQKLATTTEAIKSEKLKATVWEALNETHYFRLPRPVTGTLVL